MAVPIILMAGALGGALLALDARTFWNASAAHPYFPCVAGFGTLVIGPAVVLLYFLYPDWSLMYLINPKELPLPFMLLSLGAFSMISPLLGFELCTALVREGFRKSLFFSLWALAGSLSATVALCWKRLWTLGFYEAYHYDGELLRLPESHASVVVCFVFPAIGMSWILTRYYLRHQMVSWMRKVDSMPLNTPQK